MNTTNSSGIHDSSRSFEPTSSYETFSTAAQTELSSQVRTNALSSYFFLGFLYLFAYNNPNFSHAFVRAHAWAATRIHIALLGFMIVYNFLLSRLLNYPIPVIQIPVSRVVVSAGFIYILFLLFRGAHLAYKGKLPGDTPLLSFGSDTFRDLSHEKIQSEADIARTLLSFFPFIGVFVAERFATPLTQVGSRISGYSSALLLFETIFFRGENLVLVTLFFLTLFIVTVGVFLISGKSVSFLNSVQYLPTIENIQIHIKTIPEYLLNVFAIVIGKKHNLSYLELQNACRMRLNKTEEELGTFFQDTNMIFSPYLIYIPVINLIFLPQFFSPKKSRYVLAINQGIILTLLAVLLWYFTDNSGLLMLCLLPMMLGIATVTTRPFLQIPLLYEAGVFLSSLTFGIISHTKQAREKSKEVREVRLKVE